MKRLDFITLVAAEPEAACEWCRHVFGVDGEPLADGMWRFRLPNISLDIMSRRAFAAEMASVEPTARTAPANTAAAAGSSAADGAEPAGSTPVILGLLLDRSEAAAEVRHWESGASRTLGQATMPSGAFLFYAEAAGTLWELYAPGPGA